MTIFEYLAIGYSLILSFAVLRALSGVPYAVGSPGRYWVHVLWLATALAYCLVAFWAFWAYRNVEWIFAEYILVLAIPALMYVFSSLLVPPDPTRVTSWRDHFFGVRLPLFSTGILLEVTIILSNQSALDVDPLHPTQISHYVLVAIYAIGLASTKPALHAILPLAYASVIAADILIALPRPDWVVPTSP